jgi:hypothetical protein
VQLLVKQCIRLVAGCKGHFHPMQVQTAQLEGEKPCWSKTSSRRDSSASPLMASCRCLHSSTCGSGGNKEM